MPRSACPARSRDRRSPLKDFIAAFESEKSLEVPRNGMSVTPLNEMAQR